MRGMKEIIEECFNVAALTNVLNEQKNDNPGYYTRLAAYYTGIVEPQLEQQTEYEEESRRRATR